MRLAVLLFCCALTFGQDISSAPETQSQAPANSHDQKSQKQDYGLATGAPGRQMGVLDILSDTQGVDFGPYLRRILPTVRENWYHLISESQAMKKGKLAIEFAITKDGKVPDMRLAASSGDGGLDRAAWGSIAASNPFPPLPTEFSGPYLALRFRFYYNPDKSDLDGSAKNILPEPAHTNEGTSISSIPSKSSVGVDISAAVNETSNPVQQSEPADVAGYCAILAGTAEHSEALAKVCEFALSVHKKLPDVICERKTKRYWKAAGNESLFDNSDEITAQVTYRDGQEYDSEVRVDGKPAGAAAPLSSGPWSIGEFALSLSTLFMPFSKPEFRYRNEEKVHGTPAVVFDFHVSAENNKYHYYLRYGGEAWFPEYTGRLWLDKTDFRLLRLERETADMPSEPITRMKTATDYSLVALGDGTSMVLPVYADVRICPNHAQFPTCARNIVTFAKWQKFRATTNIILNPN